MLYTCLKGVYDLISRN